MTEHIGEFADLYAIGALGDAERARVDAHVRSCEVCAAEIGRAENTVTQLIAPISPGSALDRRMTGAFARSAFLARQLPALAAVFLIGLLPALGLWLSGRDARGFDADRETAVQAMVASHFAHAQFKAAAGAPKAKLIYARTGSWVYVVAQTNRHLALSAVVDGRSTPLGSLHVQGNAAELFVAHPPHAREFILSEGSREIARVTLSGR